MAGNDTTETTGQQQPPQSLPATQTEKKSAMELLLTANADKLGQLLPVVNGKPVMTADKLMRIAISAVRKSDPLKKALATQNGQLTFINALADAATLGLEVCTAKQEAFLIPYKDDVTLVIGYQGMISLAARCGIKITCVDSIRERDTVSVMRGNCPKLTHTYDVMRMAQRGDIRACYCCWDLADGTNGFHIMSIEELQALQAVQLEQLKRRGANVDRSPWASNPEAMFWKTTIRRGMKFVPKNTPEAAQLAAAIEYDDREEYTAGPTVTVPSRRVDMSEMGE